MTIFLAYYLARDKVKFLDPIWLTSGTEVYETQPITQGALKGYTIKPRYWDERILEQKKLIDYSNMCEIGSSLRGGLGPLHMFDGFTTLLNINFLKELYKMGEVYIQDTMIWITNTDGFREEEILARRKAWWEKTSVIMFMIVIFFILKYFLKTTVKGIQETTGNLTRNMHPVYILSIKRSVYIPPLTP
ncbi:unnamed protein product [Gordionus sp. m RMFG-2023]